MRDPGAATIIITNTANRRADLSVKMRDVGVEQPGPLLVGE